MSSGEVSFGDRLRGDQVRALISNNVVSNFFRSIPQQLFDGEWHKLLIAWSNDKQKAVVYLDGEYLMGDEMLDVNETTS